MNETCYIFYIKYLGMLKQMKKPHRQVIIRLLVKIIFYEENILLHWLGEDCKTLSFIYIALILLKTLKYVWKQIY